MFRAPSMNSLNGSVVPFYWECEMAGTVTDFYLLQKPGRIISELGSIVKIPIDFLEKREIFCHGTPHDCRNGRGTETSPYSNLDQQ